MSDGALSATVRQGYLWTLVGQGMAVGLQIVWVGLQGRWLDPKQIGVVTAALWMSGLAQVGGDIGLGSAMIRRRDWTATQLTALADRVTIVSVALTAILVLTSPILAWWNQDVAVLSVAVLMAPVFFFQNLCVTPQSLLTRDLHFRAVTISGLAGLAAQVLLLWPCVVLAGGPLGVAWAMIGNVCVRFVILRSAAARRPARPADTSVVPAALAFGREVAAGRALFYLYSNADFLVLGRFAGEAELGIYSQAFRLAYLPIQVMTVAFNVVAYPAFVALEDDPAGLREAYIQTLRWVALAACPVTAGLAAAAPDVIAVIIGQQWSASVLPMRILCVMAMTRSLQNVAPAYLLARGHTRANLWISGMYGIPLAAAFLLSVAWGAVGVALAWALVAVPIDVAVVAYASRVAGVTSATLASVVLPPLVRATVMAVLVMLASRWLPAQAGPMVALLRLLAEVAVGVVVYGAWTWWAEPDVQVRVRRLLA